MRNLIVPNFVICKTRNKEQPYECVDGQHRLYTIKLYINNIKHNNKFIYWKNPHTNERVFYNMPQDQLKKMSIRNISCRNLTPSEKIKFDDFQFSIHIIESEGPEPLSLKRKADIFNRLQNGERVQSWIRVRNMPNIITSTICANKMLNYMNDIELYDNIKFVRTKPKEHNAFNIYFAIRTFLIIDKQSLLDVNYMDLNIKKYLEANNYDGSPQVKLANDINKLVPKVNEIFEFIATHEFQLIPELAYIYVCVYANYGISTVSKLMKYFMNKQEKYNYYNNFGTYCDSVNKVTSAVKMGEVYNYIITNILKKTIYDMIEKKSESKYIREPAKCFYDNDKLRHKITSRLKHLGTESKDSIIEFTYSRITNKFTYDRRIYNTMNQITTLHYEKINPDRTTSNNAWKECEVLRNGVWISTYNLSMIDEDENDSESSLSSYESSESE